MERELGEAHREGAGCDRKRGSWVQHIERELGAAYRAEAVYREGAEGSMQTGK